MKKLFSLFLTLSIAITATAAHPYLVGHRGSYWAVENTKEAFIQGATRGKYDYLECDVKVTKDKKFIVSHDDDLSRFSSSTLTISGSNLADLQKVKLTQTRGSKTYTGYLCSLEEYLDICAEYNVLPVIELKWATGVNSNDQSNMPALVKVIESKGFRKTCIILTSMKPCLEYLHENYPDIKLQFLTGEYWNSHFDWCVTNGIDADIQAGTWLTETTVTKYHNAGLKVNMWTANSTSNYEKYRDMGCDFITTDYLEPSDFGWTEWPAHADSGETPVTASIKADPESVTLSADFGATPQPYKDVTITAEGLTSDMSVKSATGMFTVTTQSDWNARTGGTLRFTLNTDFTTLSTVDSYVAIVSGSNRLEVKVNGTLNDVSVEPNLGEGEEPGNSDVTLNDNITSMKEVWNYSGATKDWMSLESPMTRFIAYNDGKLYVLNCSPWNTTPSINIIDAYTGADTGSDVNLEGASGGLNVISSIRFVDGKLVGANTANANHTFTVYYWKDGVSAAPTKILEDATHGGLIMGSNIAISGNMTNGRIWATDDGCNNVLYYTITNGTVNTTPTVLALTDASGTALSLSGSRGASEVIPNADGTFWVDGQAAYPILFDATGKQTGTMQAGVFNNNTRGTALKMFAFGTKKYAAAVAYSGTSQASGYFTLTDITAGEQAATEFICKYPEAGLGSTANGQNMSSICQSTRENGTILDIWVCCVQQGVAHYTYDGRIYTGVEDVTVAAEEAPAVYYNLQGVPVMNPESGIYIRLQGGKATKVLIR